MKKNSNLSMTNYSKSASGKEDEVVGGEEAEVGEVGVIVRGDSQINSVKRGKSLKN